MISKCANPTCSERFLYLHQGKIFQLTPTPEVEEVSGCFPPSFYERFWLCDKCCKEMTVVWAGTEARLVPLPPESLVRPTSADARQKPEKSAETAQPQRR